MHSLRDYINMGFSVPTVCEMFLRSYRNSLRADGRGEDKYQLLERVRTAFKIDSCLIYYLVT
jgi:hypothetical protein